MTEAQWKMFFEIHRDLPREGPGSRQSTQRAYSLIANRFKNPRILDIGCGPGSQTLCLAELSKGQVTAVDNHEPFLGQLKKRAANTVLSGQIDVQHADMMKLPFAEESFDLIWAEGSIFIIGVAKGLADWRPFLKNRGVIAFTDATWLKEERPEELRKFWDEAYPAITSIAQNVDLLEKAGYKLVGKFVLPDTDWWDEYYNPIASKLPAIKERHKGDPEAMAVIGETEAEIAMFRKYSSFYGYVFYIGEKLGN